MANIVLIMGESGTGKSTSLRNFSKDEISFINVSGKPLPFRGKFTKTVSTDDSRQIIELLKRSTSKTIVIDDAGYLMGFTEMRRRSEKGFQKFVDIGGDFFDIVDTARKLPDDVNVFFFMHTETTKDGITKAKTSGQMLDSKICLEGLFTIVLRTCVKDGHYFFVTQNDGADTVKSPMGMFAELLIDNDCKAVDTTIREFYQN